MLSLSVHVGSPLDVGSLDISSIRRCWFPVKTLALVVDLSDIGRSLLWAVVLSLMLFFL